MIMFALPMIMVTLLMILVTLLTSLVTLQLLAVPPESATLPLVLVTPIMLLVLMRWVMLLLRLAAAGYGDSADDEQTRQAFERPSMRRATSAHNAILLPWPNPLSQPQVCRHRLASRQPQGDPGLHPLTRRHLLFLLTDRLTGWPA